MRPVTNMHARAHNIKTLLGCVLDQISPTGSSNAIIPYSLLEISLPFYEILFSICSTSTGKLVALRRQHVI